ncbi:MAG: VIT domain-containing protein [Acidobacteriota bacterium]
MSNTPLRLGFRAVMFSIIAIAAVSYSAFGQADADKTLSPYFFVNGDPAVDHLPLKDTRVEIAVTGVIADVKVTQTYRNEGSRPINATYMFPASTRAAVYGMKMRIGNQVIVAKIKEREEAKQDFEAAKKEGKSASLLEESRPNVFSMKLANIMPQEQVEIELRYTELLVPTDGQYEVVYPTVVGPRYPSADAKKQAAVNSPYLHEGEPPSSHLHITARIAAGLPIRELACTSHQIQPEWENKTVATLDMDDGDPFKGNRDFVLHYRLAGDQITSGLILYQGDTENFFLYMAQPPQRVQAADIPPRDFVFVVDVSGSMEGFPLDTAKQLLTDLVGGLRPTDYFNVVLFAGDSTVLSDKPLQANQENISRALDLLQQQRGSGGTELLPAIKEAMNLKREPDVTRSIVLVTDGYISGEQGVYDYIRENLGEANMFAFGIGTSVNRYLIEAVAKAGMGEPFIVEKASDAAAAAATFREYIQSPVLTDIQLKAVGFETYDVYPTHFPDLLAKRPIIMFGKWRGPVGGTFELTGRTGQGPYSSSFDVGSVQPESSNVALRYLWARSLIAELSDFGSPDLTPDKIKRITQLGLDYNLLTRYTSFIAVREQIVNPDGTAQEVNQPLPLPVGVTDMAVGSEPELVWMFAIFAAIGMWMAVRKRDRLLSVLGFYLPLRRG